MRIVQHQGTNWYPRHPRLSSQSPFKNFKNPSPCIDFVTVDESMGIQLVPISAGLTLVHMHISPIIDSSSFLYFLDMVSNENFRASRGMNPAEDVTTVCPVDVVDVRKGSKMFIKVLNTGWPKDWRYATVSFLSDDSDSMRILLDLHSILLLTLIDSFCKQKSTNSDTTDLLAKITERTLFFSIGSTQIINRTRHFGVG